MENSNVAAAEKILKVNFKDKNLLRTALTHSSYAYENDSEDFNEKLEFLGDAVLGLVVTEHIYNRYPDMNEGKLAKLRASLVNASMLADLSEKLKIGSFLLMSNGAEQAGGRANRSILSDCLEAVIGAIYLDQGYDVTKEFILGLMKDEIKERAGKKILGDVKSTLQELTMAKWGELPEYKINNQGGPDHQPVFAAEVFINGKIFGSGLGKNKKQAEKVAAGEALKEISKLEM